MPIFAPLERSFHQLLLEVELNEAPALPPLLSPDPPATTVKGVREVAEYAEREYEENESWEAAIPVMAFAVVPNVYVVGGVCGVSRC